MKNAQKFFAVAVSTVLVSYAGASEVAPLKQGEVVIPVGFPKLVNKYCLNNTDDDGVIVEKKCRTLVETSESQNSRLEPVATGVERIYERFEKFSFDLDQKKWTKTVDSVSYFKTLKEKSNAKVVAQMVFDKDFSDQQMHIADLVYPENNAVIISYDSIGGYPKIENAFFARKAFEADGQAMIQYAHMSVDYNPETIVVTGEFIIGKRGEDGFLSEALNRFPINEVYHLEK